MKKYRSTLLPLKPIPAAIAAMATPVPASARPGLLPLGTMLAAMTLGMNSAWAQTAQTDSSTGDALAQEQVVAQTQPLPTVQVQGARINGDFKPDVSNVGSKTPTSLRDIPQTVTVVNRAGRD